MLNNVTSLKKIKQNQKNQLLQKILNWSTQAVKVDRQVPQQFSFQTVLREKK